MKHILFSFFLLACLSQAQAQFERYYGETSVNEEFISGAATPDGGYAMFGYSHTNAVGGSDFYLVKTDAQGQQVWTNTWDFFHKDMGKKIIAMPNGNLFIVGYGLDQANNTYQGYFAMLDASGQSLWQNTLAVQDMQFVSAIPTSDGNILMMANHFTQPNVSEPMLLKINDTGAQIFTQNYGTGTCFSLIEKPNGMIVIGLNDATIGYEIRTLQSDGTFVSSVVSSLSPRQLLVQGNISYIVDNFGIIQRDDAGGNMIWQNSFNTISGKLHAILSDGSLLVSDGGIISILDSAAGNYVTSSTPTGANQFFNYHFWIEKSATEWVLGGYTLEYGGADALFDRVNASDGAEIAHISYGQVGGEPNEYGYGMRPTTDGGFILIGNNSLNQTNASRIVKTNSGGNALWQSDLGGGLSEIQDPWGVCNAPDGGYVVMGYKTDTIASGIFATKLDAQGITQWEKFYNMGFLGALGNIQPYPTGGYVIAGWAAVPTNSGNCVIRIDANGDTLWTRKFRFSSSNTSYDLCVTNDGGMVVAGRCRLTGSSSNRRWLMKLDANGNMLWQKTYLSLPSENSRFTSVVENPATGDLYAYGYFIDNVQDIENSFLLKTNAQGDSLKSYVLAGNPTLSRWSYKARLTATNEVILFGLYSPINPTATDDIANRQVSITKLDANFNLIWDNYYTNRQAALMYDGYVLSDGSLVGFGSALNPTASYNNADFYLLKTDPNGVVAITSPLPLPFEVNAYPNPATNGKITLEIKSSYLLNLSAEMYDINGKRLQQFGNVSNMSVLDLSKWAKGTYFIRILDKENHAIVKKVIML